MNRFISSWGLNKHILSPLVVRQSIFSFATSNAKLHPKKKVSKEDKAEAAQREKQVKSLLKQYYRMHSYEPPKIDPELQKEYEAIAKEYSRQMTLLHHTYERRLYDKIFLRDLAISALPTESLREQAKQTDTQQIPGKYFYPAEKARFEDLSQELAW